MSKDARTRLMYNSVQSCDSIVSYNWVLGDGPLYGLFRDYIMVASFFFCFSASVNGTGGLCKQGGCSLNAVICEQRAFICSGPTYSLCFIAFPNPLIPSFAVTSRVSWTTWAVNSDCFVVIPDLILETERETGTYLRGPS